MILTLALCFSMCYKITGMKFSLCCVPRAAKPLSLADDFCIFAELSAFLHFCPKENCLCCSALHSLLGIIAGFGLTTLYKLTKLRDTVKTMIILCTAFLLVTLESVVASFIPMSGLLSVMAMGCTILRRNDSLAKRMSAKFSKIWVVAELVLFTLVGATVDIAYVQKAGLSAILLLLVALAIRTCGVLFCVMKTKLSLRECLFCAIAYLPKATVQAAIGGLPLAAGISAGNTIQTVAVLAILISAPLGAIGIDTTYRTLLE